jgi:hypothetical protein
VSVWSTPITWSNGPLTAAQLNTVRDNLNWLKGFADLITNSSASDTGTGVGLSITRGAGTDHALQAKISGDADYRLKLRAGSGIQMGDGSAAPQVVMSFGSGVLTFDRYVHAGNGIKLPTKSGTVNDGDIPGYFTGAAQGSAVFDTANNRLYIRGVGSWRYVATVAA